MKTERPLLLASVLFTVFILVYNVYFDHRPEVPLWVRLLFSLLQGIAWYYCMRWATQKFAKNGA